MDFSTVLGFLGLLLSSVVPPLILERGYAWLDPSQKLRLMERFSFSRSFGRVPLLLVFGVYVLLMNKPWIDRRLLVAGCFGALALYTVLKTFWERHLLAKEETPPEFRRYFTASQVIGNGGFLLFVAVIMRVLWR